MKFKKDMLLLYAVTDGNATGNILYEKVEKALKGGVTMVQLRRKDISEDELLKNAIHLAKLCRHYNVPLIVNDNVEVALKSGADGVHVGIEDMPVAEIRAKAPKDFIIGATAKTVEAALAAEKSGADYLGSGAVFPSPTKQNAIRITPEQLQKICSSVSIPVVAIGGITYDNASEIRGAGMAGIAVVSAIFGACDVENATLALKEKAKTLI